MKTPLYESNVAVPPNTCDLNLAVNMFWHEKLRRGWEEGIPNTGHARTRMPSSHKRNFVCACFWLTEKKMRYPLRITDKLFRE